MTDDFDQLSPGQEYFVPSEHLLTVWASQGEELFSAYGPTRVLIPINAVWVGLNDGRTQRTLRLHQRPEKREDSDSR
jgi:hypothetical protein